MRKAALLIAIALIATPACAQTLSGPPSLPIAGGTMTGPISTPQVFDIRSYGASTSASSAANTTAIQNAITAAQAVNGVLYVPSAGGAGGCYNYTAGALTVSNNLTIRGDHELDSWNGGADVPLGSPPLLGSVLCPSSNGSDALDISGTSLTVNIEDVGFNFGTGFSGTGDGIHYIPSSTNQGLSGSHWKHVRVYGVDGNHYSYNLQNPIFDVFDDVYSYGGGCLKLYGNSTTTNYGNSVFNLFYGKDIVGGTANCVTISASASQRLNDITFVQGTAVTANISAVNPGNPPTNTQYIWNMDANVQAISGFGMDLETNVNSKVLLGASAKSNNMDWGSMFTDAAAIESPAWTTNGIQIGPLTRTFTDTTSSGTVAVQATNVLPSVTLKASSAATYTKAPTLYLGAPVASTNVTITSPESLYATGEIYTASDLTTAAGLFATGTTQINTNAGSNTTAIGNGSTSGTITIGGASNTTNLSSATVALSGNETVSGTLNKLTLTTPATAATLTLANNKTFTVNNTLTLAGTDSTTLTFPGASDTVAGIGTAQTWTAVQTITNSYLRLLGSSTGYTTFTSGNAGSTNYTLTVPAATDTIAELGQAQTFTAAQTITDGIANRYGLNITPPTLTSGTQGSGINVTSTVNDASNVDGVTWFSNTTATSLTNGSLIFDWQVGSSSIFKSDKFGDITAAGGITLGSGNQLLWTGRGILNSPGSGKIQIGGVDAASPAAQTLMVTNVVAGTSNTAGVNLTLAGSQGTGTGTGGSVIIQTAPAGSSGTSQNAEVVALTIDAKMHLSYGGTAPAISACGTSPTIDGHATDSSGTVTVGATATSCTITFNKAFATWNHCRVTAQTALTGLAYSYTLSAITVTATGLGGDLIDYGCDGQ